jgi:hypothetical protein
MHGTASTWRKELEVKLELEPASLERGKRGTQDRDVDKMLVKFLELAK